MQTGVEALLDDGGAEVAGARVVAVADREHRPPSGDRGRAERRPLDARHRGNP